MFSMICQNHIGFSNPFMMGCGYNPRMNFFMGMALGTSGLASLVPPPIGYIPMCGCSSYPMMPNYADLSLFIVPSYSNPLQYNLPYQNLNTNTYNYALNAPSLSSGNMHFTYMPQISTFTMPKLSMPSLTFQTGTPAATSTQTSDNTQETDQVSDYGKVVKRQGAGYGKEFLDKVKQISKEINCDYRDLLAIMNAESGLDASRPCSDPRSTAVGLIQFNDAAARSIGTTTNALKNMSPIEQLDYVKKYYLQWRSIKHYPASQKLTAGELYALTFTPAYVRPDSDVLTKRGSVEYNSNKSLDTNKDGVITKSELSARVDRYRVSDRSFLA